MTKEVDEACDLIRDMGFDAEMARNLIEICRLSVAAGRKAAIEECAKIADRIGLEADRQAMGLSYGELYGMQSRADAAEEIAKVIRALSSVTLHVRSEEQP